MILSSQNALVSSEDCQSEVKLWSVKKSSSLCPLLEGLLGILLASDGQTGASFGGYNPEVAED